MRAVRNQVSPHAAAIQECMSNIPVVHSFAVAYILDQPVSLHVDQPLPVIIVSTSTTAAIVVSRRCFICLQLLILC